MEQHKWIALEELQDPFNDAENYRTRKQKDFFNQLFLRTEDLYKCLAPATYYVLGEKGSGKTAYATYLDNNTIRDTQCKLMTMTESQYKRFIALKRQGKLDYSDYANIWRPMLLSMVAQLLVLRCKGFLSNITGKFTAIEELIEAFNESALNPEVEVAFRIVSENRGKMALGLEGVGTAGFEDMTQRTDEVEVIRHHLLQKESELKKAIAELRLSKDAVLFIDGIDYRPEQVSYKDYLACVKGLGEAAWHLNSDYFGNIRDSRGRIKIVLLLRPDVFHSMNIYNSNSRLRDNSVLLDWTTTEKEMRNSRLYSAAGRYFASQQNRPVDEVDAVEAADWYMGAGSDNTFFRRFLRSSFQKPRDVLTFVQTARHVASRHMGKASDNRLPPDVVSNPAFTKDYAIYLLGEVKNYAAFYMEQPDFAKYLKFFQYLDGKSEFTYEQFCGAFQRFKKWINGEHLHAVEYLRDPEALLQFFYDVNVIGYTEAMQSNPVGNTPASSTFVHWAYRERTLIDIAPQVKTSGLLNVNPGISKALDIGRRAQEQGNTPDGHKRKARFARPGFGGSNNKPRGGKPRRKVDSKNHPEHTEKAEESPSKYSNEARPSVGHSSTKKTNTNKAHRAPKHGAAKAPARESTSPHRGQAHNGAREREKAAENSSHNHGEQSTKMATLEARVRAKR